MKQFESRSDCYVYLDQKIVEELLEETQFFSNYADVNQLI